MNSQMQQQETHKFPSQYTDYKGDSYFGQAQASSGLGKNSKFNKKKKLSSINSEGSKDQGSYKSSIGRKSANNNLSSVHREEQPQMTDSMVQRQLEREELNAYCISEEDAEEESEYETDEEEEEECTSSEEEQEGKVHQMGSKYQKAQSNIGVDEGNRKFSDTTFIRSNTDKQKSKRNSKLRSKKNSIQVENGSLI